MVCRGDIHKRLEDARAAAIEGIHAIRDYRDHLAEVLRCIDDVKTQQEARTLLATSRDDSYSRFTAATEALPVDLVDEIDRSIACDLEPIAVGEFYYATAFRAVFEQLHHYLQDRSIPWSEWFPEPLEELKMYCFVQTDRPQIDAEYFYARLVKEWSLATRSLAAVVAYAPTVPAVTLSDAEQDLLDVVSCSDRPLSQSEIFTILAQQGKIPSEGTTKTMLATMKRHGILASGPNGKGYKLPS